MSRRIEALNAAQTGGNVVDISCDGPQHQCRAKARPGADVVEISDGKDEVCDESADDLAAKMYDDFTLQDLVELAKTNGIKREGVGWGKDGTPKQNKKEIVAALIAHHRAAATEARVLTEHDEEHELKQMQDAGWWNYYVEEDEHPTDYMPRCVYRRRLMVADLLQADQDVFHIIAAANGGPDHPDNYLGALGAGFNRSIGAKKDYFCCFIAGLEKTKKAVRRALEAEALYHKHPKMRSKIYSRATPTLFSDNCYNREAGRCLTAEELVERGRQEWLRMRLCESSL